MNQGVYGCIFNPPLTCKGKKANKDSSKVGKFTQISDMKNEINIWKLLTHFPDSNKYVILPEMNTLCEPSAKAIQDEKGIEKCRVLQKQGTKDMIQFQLEYGGKSLSYRIQGDSIMKLNFRFYEGNAGSRFLHGPTWMYS